MAAETKYPCGRNLDFDCPTECPTYPKVKMFYDELAEKYGVPVEKLIEMIRSQDDILKALFAISAHTDNGGAPNQCQKSEEARTITLVRPKNLNRGKF